GTPSPHPLETLARLRELPDATWIRGNGERWLLEPPEDRPEVRETYGRFRDQISAEEVEWLFNLPPRAELDGILYVHGSPLAAAAYRAMGGGFGEFAARRIEQGSD